MLALLFVPIVLVIGYSFFDNVLINQHPKWVGLQNYIEVLTDPIFLKSMKNTAVFEVCNVVFHLVIGMTLALMVNAKGLRPAPKAFFRVIYLLPWMFNATVIAILWKLLQNPNGIVNYLLVNAHIITEKISWLSDRSIVLGVLTFINISFLYDQYSGRLAGYLQ